MTQPIDGSSVYCPAEYIPTYAPVSAQPVTQQPQPPLLPRPLQQTDQKEKTPWKERSWVKICDLSLANLNNPLMNLGFLISCFFRTWQICNKLLTCDQNNKEKLWGGACILVQIGLMISFIDNLVATTRAHIEIRRLMLEGRFLTKEGKQLPITSQLYREKVNSYSFLHLPRTNVVIMYGLLLGSIFGRSGKSSVHGNEMVYQYENAELSS